MLDEGYSLDLVVDRGGGQLIAIEVDGPSHFVGREPTSKHLGWRLVSVPYWQWDETNHRDRSKELANREAYLSKVLAGAPAHEVSFAPAAPGLGTSAMSDSHSGSSSARSASAAAGLAGAAMRSPREPTSGHTGNAGEGGERHKRFEPDSRLSARPGASDRGATTASALLQRQTPPSPTQPLSLCMHRIPATQVACVDPASSNAYECLNTLRSHF